jgi:hypothetical protein
LEPTLLHREVWEYHAQTHQEPLGAITTGLAVPLPTLPLSAVALLNRPEPYESSHRALLTQFATPLELLARLNRARQQLEQRERALKWLGRLPNRLGSELSLQRALEAVESLMRKAAPEGGGVWLYNENHQVLLQALQYGASPLPARIDIATLPSEWKKEPLPGGYASALAVPLQVAERTLGVMTLLTETPHEFTLSEVELLFTLANTGAPRFHTLERLHA